MGKDRPFLVTGGGGQLGKALGRLLPNAIVLDRSALDVTRPDQVHEVFEAVRPGVVVNAAAYTRVDAAESEPELAERVNVRAVETLVDVTGKHGALLVQPSTDYVFAGDKPGKYTEEDPTGPLSVYGRTKLASEKAAASAPEHLIVRTSWVFGRGTNFVRSIVTAARTRRTLDVVCDQRGLPTYAFDLAKAINALVGKGARGLFHVAGGGEPVTWAELAAKAVGAAGLEAEVTPVTTEQYYAGKSGPVAPRPANSALDCAKAARIGVVLRSWESAVEEYVNEELAV
ncbi:MAG: dTDP-4-dehydrorhamnose reductase [Actinomycetota bacterium]|nr:dTDP-4-dehydrorhamnose reductase [Actinomycetota bacterium]